MFAIRLATLSITVALGGILSMHDALACDCPPLPPPKEALNKSAAVFLAKVTKVEQAGLGWRVTLDVERWWKGSDATTQTVFTAKNGAICGYTFKEGERYLVYAFSRGQQGEELFVSLCSRTGTAEQAEKAGDLKELGAGTAAKR
jgi:hypothetical protein